MEDAYSALKKLITFTQPISDEDWQHFKSFWKPFSARRKEIITHSGDTEKYLYFVVEGVQRVYYFDSEGREATIVFTYSPSFGGILDSLMLQKPSQYLYETLSPSSFLRMSSADLHAIMNEKPGIQKIIVKGLSETLAGMMKRMAELQCYSSEDKFRSLLQRSPHILQLVPHKYLANYLGIDPTNFSKLINKVKI
ncbi:MAG: Crp/Fnr family transcriptional regulator [Candidatus Cyclobacteriaceae bacterium M2_1C_046]